jgi:hypothetical protein
MKKFKLYYENAERAKQIKELQAMIKDPDPRMVAMYDDGEYVQMLKDKVTKLIGLRQHDLKSYFPSREESLNSLLRTHEDNEQYSRLSKLSDKELYDLSKERNLDSMVEISDRRIVNRDEIIDLLSISTPVYGSENQEEDAQDRCKRKADQVYGKKTSAYKSGAIVRCRKGKIWKKK